jgi:hypothetical protein
MLDGLKQWITGKHAPTGTGWDDVAWWAEQRQYPFRSVHGEGFVVDGRTSGTDWRLEWGPPQRDYMKGAELRLRAELPVGSALQLVVMTRALQESMEKSMFEQAVESVQTRIDNETPPETRWLVMFSRLPGADMGVLRENFVAVSSLRSWLAMWLQGPLSTALVATVTDPGAPVVLMMSRGRLTLRTALPSPDLASLQPWLRLFETAIREAHRVNAEKPQVPAETEPGSAWSPSAMPQEERKA